MVFPGLGLVLNLSTSLGEQKLYHLESLHFPLAFYFIAVIESEFWHGTLATN